MAKMTISDLKTFAASYVAAAKQAGAWSATTNNLYGLIDKIGQIVSLKGDFNDKLQELDGNDLEFGKTIEETMIDLVLPAVYGTNGVNDGTNAATEGAYDLAPAYPSVELPATTIHQVDIKQRSQDLMTLLKLVLILLSNLVNQLVILCGHQKAQ